MLLVHRLPISPDVAVIVCQRQGLQGFNRSSPVTGPTFVDATEGGKRLRRGARLWSIATAVFKSETYRFLRLPRITDEDVAAGASPTWELCGSRWGPILPQ